MILFLEYFSGRIRGGEVYNLHLYSFLRKRFPDFEPREISSIPPDLSNPFKHLIQSLALVKEKKPEIIVLDVSSGARNLLAVRWIKKNKMKVLLVVQEERLNLRSNFILVKWFVRRCEKYLVKNTDIFVVNSKYSANLVSKKGASENSECIIAHPGLENYSPLSSEIADRKGVIENPVNLLFVGVCKETKGVIYLVKAISLLKDLNIKLNIVGSYSSTSSYYKKIKKIIDQNNLQDRIQFHGFVEREQLLKLYRQSAIYVHASLMEGYGMVLAEALCFGLPIVASTAGAIPELVADGVNAVLVKPKDSKGIAAGIRRLIEDENLRESMSRTNLEKAKSLPTWDDFDRIMEERLAPLIEKLPR